MKINVFFLFVLSVLLIIFFIFKPLDIKEQKFDDVPLFNLSMFTMYELSTKGLITLMSGTEATRFEDRYAVKNIDYTDNSKNFIANMKADRGAYKKNIVTLSDNVVYFREDGLTFETQSCTYNKKTSVARADGKYILYKGSNRVIGRKLKYNNLSNTIYSRDVTARYQLKER